MFGKNEVYGVNDFKKELLLIKEYFYTIQGEGPFMGTPAYFIRFGRCSLKCHFCDTDFESNLVEMSAEELLEYVPIGVNLVVVTGGEPLLQPALIDLCNVLTERGHVVQIETSGSVCSEDFLRYLEWGNGIGVDIVCSPKTGRIVERLKPFITAYKYIVRKGANSAEDGLPIEGAHKLGSKLSLARPHDPGIPVYISPMDEYDEVKNKENYQEAARIVMEHGYTLSLQMHKIVGVP